MGVKMLITAMPQRGQSPQGACLRRGRQRRPSHIASSAKAAGSAQISRAMSEPSYALLSDRAVLAIGGPEARGFLQGLISNDIDKATASQGIYAALLTQWLGWSATSIFGDSFPPADVLQS